MTITANADLPDRSIYGGYIVLTPQGAGAVYRVPFAGFKGDYQTTQVLTPTTNGFPWLAKLLPCTPTTTDSCYFNQPSGASYTLSGSDIPYFLMHLDHHARRIEFEVLNAANGRPVHPVFSKTDVYEYVAGTPRRAASSPSPGTAPGCTTTARARRSPQGRAKRPVRDVRRTCRPGFQTRRTRHDGCHGGGVAW